MNPLKDLCNEVLSAGEMATPRPWDDELDFPHTMVLQNIKYIVTSANSADKLAKACLVLMEGLEDFSDPKMWRPSEREPMKSLGWTPAELAIQALAKAQALVGEK